MAKRFRIPLFARVIFLVAGILLFLMVAALCYGEEGVLRDAQRNEQPPVCDAELWKYVYNPSRLEIKNPCIRVTGEIRSIRKEKDGDYHILIRLDPKFRHLLNKTNGGLLVVEPVCQIKVGRERQNAKDACRGFPKSKITDIPEGGTRVVITGSYVLDLHHGWMEIHPATIIAPLQ
ncbi:hypothetical protein KGQ34_02690 [Patescibacteria group bacterium]|nr:hypothetical protein [Patescibacteria group bacterium]